MKKLIVLLILVMTISLEGCGVLDQSTEDDGWGIVGGSQ